MVPISDYLPQVHEEGFDKIAQTILHAVTDLAADVNKKVAETVVNCVREAYLKGYDDGYKSALRKLRSDHEAD